MDIKEDCQTARTENIHPWTICRGDRSLMTHETLQQGNPTKILKKITTLKDEDIMILSYSSSTLYDKKPSTQTLLQSTILPLQT